MAGKNKQDRMKTWDVYYNGEWVGTVGETAEEYARCAAYSQLEPEGADWESDKLSVSERN